MRTTALIPLAIATLAGSLVAQEPKPVPKDSVRVSIPGCSKGYAFTVARRETDQPGTANIPAGTHFRMNGPKKMMADIKVREGSMIEITGIMKRDDLRGPGGVRIGGARISPGSSSGGGVSGSPLGGQIFIDLEGWRQVPGSCPRG